MNNEFDNLLENPVIQGRVDYLTKYLKGASDNNNENYTLTLTLFSIFIENVSLFSQFLIIKSFNKYMNCLKDIDNVVQATQKEEQIHALLGVYLIKQIQKDINPTPAPTPGKVQNACWYIDWSSWDFPVPENVDTVNIFVGKLDTSSGTPTVSGFGNMDIGKLDKIGRAHV